MSQKKGMSKRQRLYYEYQKRDQVQQQLAEYAKIEHEIQREQLQKPSYNPHGNSYFT
jgi:hypothetical protein